MSKHTWKVKPPERAFGFEIIDCNNHFICQMNHHPNQKSEASANAEHIVKCVNSHDELLDALKLAKKRIVELTLMSYVSEDASCKTLNKINEAITKAEGK